MATKTGQKSFSSKAKKFLRENGMLSLLALPGILYFFLFSYLPMFGSIIAFKDYKFSDGIFGSAWQKPIYNNFIYLFSSESVMRATRNTILLNILFISVSTIAAVALAVLLNEITHMRLKKVIQTFSFLPYFMSWIVISVMVYALLAYDSGVINNILASIGLEKVDWYSEPLYWPWILLITTLWQGTGYSAVIYLAAISGIDPSCYEAARIDGANRRQMIFRITIPLLVPTILIMTLLSIGRIMNSDFGMFYGLVGENSLVYSTTDVLDTFIYRTLRKTGDIGMSSAASLYQSVISFALVLISNKVSNKISDGTKLF